MKKTRVGLIEQLKSHKFDANAPIESPPLERLLKECFKSTKKSKYLKMWLPWDGSPMSKLFEGDGKTWLNERRIDMARFRGTLQGGRGEVHRCGHSHIKAAVNGWNFGVEVELKRVPTDAGEDEDIAKVYITGGSRNALGRILVWHGTGSDLYKLRKKVPV